MSQSPLARSTRRSLPAFAHAPSRLSKSTSTKSFRDSPDPLDEEDGSDSDSPAPSRAVASSTSGSIRSVQGTPTNRYSRTTSTSNSTQTQTQTQTPTPRHTPSRTYSSPHTPKIVHSPYAANSPHAGPSRSASIPFDMAANAKDARRRSIGRREETPEVIGRDGEASDSPAPVPVKKGRKGIIRKKPLYKRVLEMPQSLIDRYQYDLPQSILDILPHPHLANPIALALHVIHYILLAPLFPGHNDLGSVLRTGTREKGRWERFEDEHTPRGRSILGGWSSAIMTFLMLSLALGNAVYLFSRFKNYDMQLRSSSDPIKSPHASPAPAPRVHSTNEDSTVEGDGDVFSVGNGAKSKIDAKRVAMILGRGIWMTAKFLFSATMSAIGKPTDQNSNNLGSSGGEMQTLRVWEPPAFCLAFFCAFPPTSPILTHILTSLHPLLTPLIHLSTSFLLSHLATSYAQLVKDRMYLSAEVMREYDHRFVYKKVFSSRVDRGVMTNEAELVW